MKKKKIKTKFCNRCKTKIDIRKFKNEKRERLSGKYIWLHPWCNKCRMWVKETWGSNWKGAQDDDIKEKTTTSVSNIIKRKTNKTMYFKRTNRSISKHKTRRHTVNNNTLRTRKNRVPNTSSEGHIIKSLRKLKDNKV